jgi:hypothetical protein
MPAYGYHAVGAGYIDVYRAVELASSTTGRRSQFLAGDTAWSSQGQWNSVADANALINYAGAWQTTTSALASDGSYRKSSVTKKSVPRVNFSFAGESAKLAYPRDSKGGLADVYVDGSNRGRISFYNATPDVARLAITGLNNSVHRVELRGLQGSVYFDGAQIDGALLASNVQLVDATETFTGTILASANNLVVQEIPFDVDSDVIGIKASLSWTGGVDLDYALVDPTGAEVASGASLANPENLEYAVTVPGTYKYRVKGYVALAASYTIRSTETRAVVTTAP